MDNFLEIFTLQSRNGLKIIDFEWNKFDDELEYLNANDIRDYLEKI